MIYISNAFYNFLLLLQDEVPNVSQDSAFYPTVEGPSTSTLTHVQFDVSCFLFHWNIYYKRNVWKI